jgi:hypothetical protein
MLWVQALRAIGEPTAVRGVGRDRHKGHARAAFAAGNALVTYPVTRIGQCGRQRIATR